MGMSEEILPNAAMFAWLQGKAENVTSQWGENGLLNAIFERIGAVNKFCCECGAGDGWFFSNTWPLLNKAGERLGYAGDWSGLQIEADEQQFQKLAALYAGDKSVDKNIVCYNYKVAPTGAYSFDRLLENAGAPTDLDLLVIDVDGQDYWLFNSLLKFRPRVVVVEYDPSTEPDFVPPIDGEGQAGLQAILKLGVGKGYWPVIATQTNVIFVQQELAHLVAEARAGAMPNHSPECGTFYRGCAPDCPKEKWEQAHVEEESAISRAPRVACVMSTPRLGFLSTMDCVMQALPPLGISFFRGEGAFWSHSLSRGISRALASGHDFIITIDYDTVFRHKPTDNDMARLVCLLVDNPDVDVIVAAQMKREGGPLLASTKDSVKLLDALIPITQGHFGLTIFRAEVFSKLSKPWFWEKANENGDWEENRVDADIGFWKNCEEAGVKVAMSLDVMVGHLEMLVTWPGQDLKPVYQPVNDWRDAGKPASAFDRQRVIDAVNANPALLYAPKLEMGG